ncbi:MAG TPA: hypothetical protein VLC09_03815 [Polyangiaceae bacterium]|nr:hypothetical protein [Polyangiaceae bacterium]
MAEGSPWGYAPLRLVVASTARGAFERRMVEGLAGLTSAGALFGIGFAAEGPDMTWSHVAWVSSGVIGVGSLLSLVIPSDEEKLAGEAGMLNDEQLRARFHQLAEEARLERQVGAVFGSLVGAAGITAGVLVLEEEWGDMSNDSRLVLGSSLVASGALAVTGSLTMLFLPTAVERGDALLEPPKRLAFSAAPLPNGASVSLSGTF